MACLHCGADFTGRPNKIYCSARCKKGVENQRAKLRTLANKIADCTTRERLGLQKGDYHAVRLARAQRERAIAELEAGAAALRTTGFPSWLPAFVTRLAILTGQLKTP
jgi:hypothetical protein